MDNYSTVFENVIGNNLTLKEILQQETQRVLNLLLKAELTEFLKYDKYDPAGYNSGNSRNGYYERTLKTIFGEITLSIPRDRKGEFSNKLIDPYRRTNADLENTIIYLYKHGTTTREIADMIEKIYGCHYSPQSVSNITKVMQQEVEAFHSRLLERQYIAIYCDATYIPLRRGSVQKEALHVLLGITPDGRKEVLDYTIAPHENCATYEELLRSVKNRGVEDVLLFVTDGFMWLDDTCRKVFPRAKHQYCWVHLNRNIRTLVRKYDWKVVKEELKEIYTADDRKQAVARLEAFLDRWYDKYPKLTDRLYDTTDLFQYMMLPERIRKCFYTNNALEGLNNLLKRYTRKKEQFPDENSLERFVCAIYQDYNAEAYFKTMPRFEETAIEIKQLFDEMNEKELNLDEEFTHNS